MTIVPNDANNRLTRWGGKTYSYDPNGNLLADGTHSYQWNERNQLTGLSAGATSLASFSYDSLGTRVRHQKPSSSDFLAPAPM
ncbi:MAG: hypothetical protein KA711_05675 [Ideonella sp. WA131b]|nr:hypothetical protein [Ideonella sp. WA131b]